MLCQNCGKNEANIRYTQIINGVKKEIAICSRCAKEMGMDGFVMPDFPINFNSFLGDFFNDYAENALLPNYQNEIVKCKKCGTTYEDFINTGMFGCSECYNTFSNPIDSLLKNLHGSSKHSGRRINSKNEEIIVDDNEKNNSSNKKEMTNSKDSKKKDLKKELEKAIREERYEDAAKIRDQLKEGEE